MPFAPSLLLLWAPCPLCHGTVRGSCALHTSSLADQWDYSGGSVAPRPVDAEIAEAPPDVRGGPPSHAPGDRQMTPEIVGAPRLAVAGRPAALHGYDQIVPSDGDQGHCSDDSAASPLSWNQGPRLHRDVPPERWCVTRGDIRDLRWEVQTAVREGRIMPTSQDPFDPRDDAVGPSFYTVVEQHIKPATARSRASWALQRHPEGLDCDIFVTHAWAEGVYEFVDKVLASWPSGARHAWICTLSMPQHLDVSALLSSPRDSPFAKGLASARELLVVPNRRSSVYSRLWCVYEAYLAQEKGQVIRTAVRPHLWSTLRGLCGVSMGLFVGLVARVSFFDAITLQLVPEPHRRPQVVYMWFQTATLLVVALATLVADSLVRGVLHVMGAALVACDLFEGTATGVAFLIYFVIAEVDRLRLAAYEVEVANLKRGFEGSVANALCTDLADRAAIWEDIGGDAALVDRTVDVLMRAKMSTPLWSRLAERGFDVQDAAFMERAFLVFVVLEFLFRLMAFLPFNGVNVFSLVPDPGSMDVAGIPDLVASLVWMFVMCLQDKDRRSFSFRALQKVTALRILVSFALSTCMIASGQPVWYWQECNRLVATFLTLTLILTPPLVVLRAPVVGRLLVRLVLVKMRVRMLRGRWSCATSGCKLPSGPSSLFSA